MKTFNLTRLIFAALCFLPIFYLAFIWNELPGQVPLHWNIDLEIDRWGSKNYLWLISILTSISCIFILLSEKYNQPLIQKMGIKYFRLKTTIIVFISLVVTYIFYAIKVQTLDFRVFISLYGIFFIISGNYLQTLTPNFILGIRLPWTLSNSKNWIKTHCFSGRLYIGIGILLLISCAFLDENIGTKISIVLILVAVILPILYSFLVSKK